jgi:cytochrome b involved in lipid metabolism
MPKTQSTAEPRKRKQTIHATDDANLLVLAKNKKVRATKQAPKPTPKRKSTAQAKTSQSSQRVSIEIEEVLDDMDIVQGEHPLNPNHIIEAAGDPAPDLIEVDNEDEEEPEKPEESAESELGEFQVNFTCCCIH